MSRQSLKVRIHTYPYFDNVMVHEPGAEIALADPGAFSNSCMHWVEKPVSEGAPKIETPKIETPKIEAPFKAPQAKVAGQTRPGGDSDAKAAPAKRGYKKRKVAKQTKVPKPKTFAPALVPAPSTKEPETLIAEPSANEPATLTAEPSANEPATLIAEPSAKEVPVTMAGPLEERAARSSEPSPSSEPPPASQRGADTPAGAAAGEAEKTMSAIAKVT